MKRIKIGSKPVERYILAVVFELEKTDAVEISAIGNGINKLDRIVKILTRISGGSIHVERSLETVDNKSDLTATVYTLRLKGGGA